MSIKTAIINKLFGNQIQSMVSQQVETRMSEVMEKSIGDPASEQLKTLMHNPWYHMYNGLGYYDRPTHMTFKLLKQMSEVDPVVSAILVTRINQVSSFAKQSDIAEKSQNKPLGFSIIHKRKSPKKLTKGEIKFSQELEDVISNCGYTDRWTEEGQKRDRFRSFLRKVTRDRLTYDQINFELIKNRKGEVAEFWATDASTIRVTSPTERKKGVQYVQVIDNMVVTEYSKDDLAFSVANPRTDINVQGYGFSELEMLTAVVTSHLNTNTYNRKFFSQGLGIQGILNLVTKDGKIPSDVMEAFKMQFRAGATGVNNAWKTPITNADKMEWINLKPSNRDMEYRVWIEYLIKVAAAVYQIDPAEINFNLSGSAGQKTNFESGQEARLKFSRDKGLKPLLETIADTINEYVVESYTDDFMFAFVGLDARDEKDIVSLRTQEAKCYKTIDEVRDDAGLDALGEEKGGHLILDPQYTMYLQGQQQSQQQGEEGMEGGPEGGQEEEQPEGEEEPEGAIDETDGEIL